MLFSGYCGPDINPDIIIYFHLLHNEGGRFKIVSTISHVLCVLLFMNEFMPSVLIVILILLHACKPMLQTRNDRKVPKQIFRSVFFSIFVVVLVITAVFSMIELVEFTNRAFLEVFVLRSTI
jgi:hypothetical protein